jgi:hypothetical protein
MPGFNSIPRPEPSLYRIAVAAKFSSFWSRDAATRLIRSSAARACGTMFRDEARFRMVLLTAR